MSIIQFINALERYSVDVLLLALAVCLITGLIKLAVPANYKKYITFIPFIAGCAVYAAYLFITDDGAQIMARQTVIKGIQCGGTATIYYVMYEQFIRGKKSLIGITDTAQLAVAGILRETVLESYLYNVSAYIAQNVSANLKDVPYCVTLSLNALNGKTKPGVSEGDITAVSRLIVSALGALKQ